MHIIGNFQMYTVLILWVLNMLFCLNSKCDISDETGDIRLGTQSYDVCVCEMYSLDTVGP